MLEQLSIRNFQAHERLTIDLSPTVTTIVGPSDAGKTAILRALKWVALNRPAGVAHLRRGARIAKVRLKLDGRAVIRRRGTGGNVYELDGSTKRAFGNDVPASIANRINVDANNFADQHDPPFWFSLPPGRVSRELNRIVNLGAIDRSLAAVGAALRKARTIAEDRRETAKLARAKRRGLAGVVAADRALAAVEAIKTRLDDIRDEIGRLDQTIVDAERLRDAAPRRQLPDIGILGKLRDRAYMYRGAVESLDAAIGEYNAYKDRLCQSQKRADDALEKLRLKRGQRCPLCGNASP